MKNKFVLFLLPTWVLFSQIATVENKRENPLTSNLSIIWDSVLLQTLKHIDKKKYIGLTVDTFSKEPKISKFKGYSFIEEPIGHLNYIYLRYSKKIGIKVYVKKYQFINPNGDRKKAWKLSEDKKENISAIALVHDRIYIEVIE